MQIRAAKDSELEELIELQVPIFRPGAYDRFRSYVREDPSYKLDLSRVLLVEGRIVSHIRIWDRLIRVRGVALRVGGLGSVVTRPEYRGRGYAGALMKDTDRYLYEAGYDMGSLFSIIGTGYYGALGWASIPLPTFTLEAGPNVGTCHGSKDVRPLDIDSDLDAVASIYEHCSKDLTGPEIRSREYWKIGPSRHRGVFPKWGVERDGALVSYLSFDVEAERIWVKEACALGGSEATYGELASIAVEEARAKGLKSIDGSLIRGHPLVAALAVATGGEPIWGAHDEMMVKLMNWESFTRKMSAQGISQPEGKQEKIFWQALFGVCPAPPDAPFVQWMASLPECDGPFYWWPDIF